MADLVSTMLLPNTGKSNKIMICKHLVNLMTEEDGLMCHGAVRQRNYFASYCVDLALQQLAQQFSANLEETLRSMLTLWVNTLSPVQDEFNINGVIYTRAELLKMLEAPVLIGREWRQPRSHLADQLERALKGRGNTSNAQTVHDHGVQSNAGRVLNIMRAKHGRTDQISDQEVVAMIEKVSRHRKNKDDILSGMHACLQNSRRDNNWNVDLTPQQAIKEVVQYILSVKDPTMRLNLTQALLHRLEEIQLETPCVSGKLQRLLDVPNGIDPDMDFAGADRQIAEDMATLAGKTYEQFNKLIDEGIEAIQEEEKNPDTTQSIAKQIGLDMFNTRINQDMKLLGGLEEQDLAPHRERLKAGFD
ncbi:MAG TPA: hypothetical protein VFV57_00255 [Limnobacter sp.]|nr:hypothetical protein [Limnobacter sp.]